jgi:hypothetical protein
MICISFNTAMKPTPLSTVVQECAELAIADCGYQKKGAADAMDITLSALSEGLTGARHLSLQRLTNLGPLFLLHFCKRVMRHLGGVALSAEEVALLRGAASLGVEPVNQLTERKVA